MTTITKHFIEELDREAELLNYFPSIDITGATASSDTDLSRDWYKATLEFSEEADTVAAATSSTGITKVIDEQTLSGLGLSHTTLDFIQNSIDSITKDFPKSLTENPPITASQPMTLADFFHKAPPSVLDNMSAHPTNLGELKNWKLLETATSHKVNSETLSLVDDANFKHIDGLNIHPMLEVTQLAPII